MTTAMGGFEISRRKFDGICSKKSIHFWTRIWCPSRWRNCYLIRLTWSKLYFLFWLSIFPRWYYKWRNIQFYFEIQFQTKSLISIMFFVTGGADYKNRTAMSWHYYCWGVYSGTEAPYDPLTRYQFHLPHVMVAKPEQIPLSTWKIGFKWTVQNNNNKICVFHINLDQWVLDGIVQFPVPLVFSG